MFFKEKLITLLSYLRRTAKRALIKQAASLQDQRGLEIGGPSSFFGLRGGCPVYVFASIVDGVNFSTNTVWEGSIASGTNYKYFANKVGEQFIAEATALPQIQDSSYDFLLSCHSLEHVANPLKALMEWNRVLKPGGKIVLVLPDKDFTTDCKRPFTTFEHLKDDLKNGVDEHDKTHFDEIIEFYQQPTIANPDEKSRSASELLATNYVDRVAHHHVFNDDTVRKALEFAGFEILLQQKMQPFHMIAVARKIKGRR